MSEDILIDARGMLCPLPVLRLRKALLDQPAGARLRLLATDAMAAVDVPHFCHETGHLLVQVDPDPNGGHSFLVECRTVAADINPTES